MSITCYGITPPQVSARCMPTPRMYCSTANFLRLRVSSGSDLTASVLRSVVKPQDVLVLVGATQQQAQELRSRYGLAALRHIQPPMNFIDDAAAVESCLRAIEDASPFRFCFLAIGSPQQEIIAHKLKLRGVARGLALCVGASINF